VVRAAPVRAAGEALYKSPNYSFIFCTLPYIYLATENTVLTIRVHGGDVAPVESKHDVQQGFRLVIVRRHDAQEKLENVLVAEVRRRRGVADLGDVEDLHEVLHLDGVLAGPRADEAYDRLVD
jgi:hypothetical protein